MPSGCIEKSACIDEMFFQYVLNITITTIEKKFDIDQIESLEIVEDMVRTVENVK